MTTNPLLNHTTALATTCHVNKYKLSSTHGPPHKDISKYPLNFRERKKNQYSKAIIKNYIYKSMRDEIFLKVSEKNRYNGAKAFLRF